MAGPLKSVRFIRPWQSYGVGEVITPPATRRDWLIAHGYCELLPEKPAPVRNKAKAAAQAVGGLFTR